MRRLAPIAAAWVALFVFSSSAEIPTNSIWRGTLWQTNFGAARKVESVMQVFGDHDFVFRNGPKSYRWSGSLDGTNWHRLAAVTNEARVFRKVSWPKVEIQFARFEAEGDAAAVRGFEFDPQDSLEWILVVNATHSPELPGEGKEFIPLARTAENRFVAAQQVWLDRFDPEFLRIEPQPLCAFVSGSFKDWCEVRRENFRGMSRLLEEGKLPIWASCGGAQALAIIAEHGIEKEWDCPHCRDSKKPKTPIYTHIGHTARKACGDYSGCIFERGPHRVSLVKEDRVFAGLGKEFLVMESHCGQIAYMPKGWEWIVGPGEGTLTKSQAFRRSDCPIYAAQFHIEMGGTAESSEVIMKNFLELAREWGGYR